MENLWETPNSIPTRKIGTRSEELEIPHSVDGGWGSTVEMPECPLKLKSIENVLKRIDNLEFNFSEIKYKTIPFIINSLSKIDKESLRIFKPRPLLSRSANRSTQKICKRRNSGKKPANGGTREKNNISNIYKMGSCSDNNENFASVPQSGGRRRRRRSRVKRTKKRKSKSRKKRRTVRKKRKKRKKRR
tara:strand:- start:398 stop:964 length:567 start_codon:yes stop_codon:yes gene_type:complete